MMKDIPLNLLRISPKNVRTVNPNKAADKQLIASIAKHSILNNLVVIRGADDFEVVAGGRRLAALQWLVKEGELDPEALVPCRLEQEENATAVSLAENVARVPMHPADEFEAYRELAEQGKSIAEIAKEFGESKSQVKKLLRLGAVHEQLLGLYRKGKLSLDEMMAFAITEDKERQLACYEALKGGWFGPHQIRQFLTDDTVRSTDPLAVFVGSRAYKQAGGRTEEDLFQSTVYWVDVDLLKQLANDKLEQVKQDCLQEGWLWVEVSDAPHKMRHQCRELSAPLEGVPEALQQRIEQEEAELAALQDKEYDDMTDADFERETALEESLEVLEERKEQYRAFTAEQKALAGAVVGLSGNGEVIVYRGLVRKADEAKAAQVLATQDGTSEAQDPGLFDEQPVESQALCRDLEAYYRQAFQAQLVSQDGLCLDMLVFTLACSVFAVRDWGDTLMEVSASPVTETALEIDQTPAAQVLDQARDRLELAWLEESEQAGRFQGFMALSKAAKKRILTYCVARLARSPLQGAESSAWGEVVQLAGFNLADHWAPTQTTYFDRIKKDDLLRIGAETIDETWRDQYANSKKSVISEALAEHEAMASWLPAYLR